LGALHSFYMGLVGIKRPELNSYIFSLLPLPEGEDDHYCCWVCR